LGACPQENNTNPSVETIVVARELIYELGAGKREAVQKEEKLQKKMENSRIM
jgi:hypothetical protein